MTTEYRWWGKGGRLSSGPFPLPREPIHAARTVNRLAPVSRLRGRAKSRLKPWPNEAPPGVWCPPLSSTAAGFTFAISSDAKTDAIDTARSRTPKLTRVGSPRNRTRLRETESRPPDAGRVSETRRSALDISPSRGLLMSSGHGARLAASTATFSPSPCRPPRPKAPPGQLPASAIHPGSLLASTPGSFLASAEATASTTTRRCSRGTVSVPPPRWMSSSRCPRRSRRLG